MRLSQMRYFQATCLYKTLSKASKELHVSQPSISVAIRDLETEFGIQLFYRVGNRLTLTTAGEFLYQRVNEILAEIDTLQSQMINEWKDTSVVRVSMLPITGSYLLVQDISTFKKNNPSVKVSLTESGAIQALRGLELGECDIALTIVEQLPFNDIDVDGVILKESEFTYVVDKSHANCHLETIKICDLYNSNLILLQNDAYLTKEIKKRFNQRGVIPNVMLYALHLPLIQNLLSMGDACTFLPKELAAELDSVVCIPLEEPLKVTYALIWKNKEHYPTDVSKFIKYFRKKGISIHDYRAIHSQQ